MEEFIEELKAITTEYGVEATMLDINLAIEQFKQIRNYPSAYDEEKVLIDLNLNKNTIAMAVVELDAKIGVEGQTGHSENGINRQYSKNLLSYQFVKGIAQVI